ncbi:MAG: nitroreductase family protein [Anaerovoracaceae bacterium]
MNSIFRRTSVRKYLDKRVEEEKIEMLLRAAMAAPSAKNQQPWEFYVVRDKDKLQQLSVCGPYAGCTANATVAIVPCYRTDAPVPEYAQIDLSAATENILLQAEELDLGAVWLGVAPLEYRMIWVRKVLDLPENLEAFAIVPCGYKTKERTQIDRFDGARIHYIGK